MNIENLLTSENIVFKAYLFYCCILVLKMIAMSVLTALIRIKNKTFISSEDAVLFRGKTGVVESVERVRRAHLNDLENIPIFFIASFAYLLTNPGVGLATNLFRVFTGARIIHTAVYVVCVPQPTRAIVFFVGYFITLYMAATAIWHFL